MSSASGPEPVLVAAAVARGSSTALRGFETKGSGFMRV